MLQLHLDPYCFLIYPEDHVFSTLVGAVAVTPPKIGWLPQSDQPYVRALWASRNHDEAGAFVSPPFPFVKSPTTWLPKIMDGGEQPAASRRNDDAAPFFRASPPLWLPRIDAEQRAKKTDPPPDQVAFFRTAPAILIPRSESGERPSRPQDQSIAAFIPPLPAPTPAWYLPQEGLRPPGPRDQYGPAWNPQTITTPSTIAGMAWHLPQEGMRPPAGPDRYGVSLPPQPTATVNTIAGMAWWRQADDSRRGLPWSDEREAFTLTPAALTWLPASSDQPYVRPVVDQYQPAFIRTPSGIVTGWIVPWDQPVTAAKADQYTPPFVKPPAPAVGISGIAWWQPIEVHLNPPPSDQYQPTIALKPVAVVNTISGMAWWQAIEAHIGPPPPQLDYSPSWDPQFIVQIIPPPPNPAQFTVSGAGVSLVFAEFFVDVVLTDAPVTKRTN